MRVMVHDAKTIKKRAKKAFESKTALISIRGVSEKKPFLYYKPCACLFMMFDDTFPAEADMLGYFPLLFSEDMADEAAQFIYRIALRTDELICQCECGVSRSAGMAAAVLEHFYGKGDVILKDRQYTPNMYVYELMMKSLKKWKEKIDADRN